MAAALAVLSVPLGMWLWNIASIVTEPYLDEVFHVRQAQHYCAGHFDVWDPKITTPPGLYLLSNLFNPVLGCDITSLRILSALCIDFVLLAVVASYNERPDHRRGAWLAEHSALNIAFFPPLFFFTGLYYTEVASTLSVLVFHWCFLRLNRIDAAVWPKSFLLVALGLVSLSFRQTNIFWVAVFPAAITLVSALDEGHEAVKRSMERHASGFGDSFLSIVRTSFKMNVVYDPPVRGAWIENYLETILSVAACLVKLPTQPRRVVSILIQLMPYIIILVCFVGFVVVNGGVVLGDRSNHVATIHLPQMLYIWPYMAFFSWPLLYPYLLTLPLGFLAQISPIAPLETMLVFKRRQLLPRLALLGGMVAIASLAVHFNTIVHPFTLADNRHYTFYVFRLLTRPWWVKYLVTPIYVLCGWACIEALGARPIRAVSIGKNTATPVAQTQAKALQMPNGVRSATVSFVLIWLATTALQLITAPLVEPRYFILPWLFWRMHLPLQRLEGQTTAGANSQLDPRLCLETLWHLTVNAGTAYIFLNWGFTWPQEPGMVQRFMW